jgi:hypothetical protein
MEESDSKEFISIELSQEEIQQRRHHILQPKTSCPACKAGIPLKIIIVDDSELQQQIVELSRLINVSVPNIEIALIQERRLESRLPSRISEEILIHATPEIEDQSKEARIIDTSYRAVKERTKFFNKKRSK